MDMDNDSDAEEFSDLIYSLEALRANPDIPVEALRALEQAHEIFLRNVKEEPEIALQAYAYGLAMGAYFSPQEALAETDCLLHKARQSKSGKASGDKRRNKPWRKHASELAQKIRAEDHSLSQDRVASEIEARWKLRLICPTHSTLKKFVANLERTGELPTISRKRKS